MVVQGTVPSAEPLCDNAPPFTTGTGCYITAAWDEEDIYTGRVPERLVVGDGQSFQVANEGGTSYINAPLAPDTAYSVFTRYDIRNEANPTQVSGFEAVVKVKFL